MIIVIITISIQIAEGLLHFFISSSVHSTNDIGGAVVVVTGAPLLTADAAEEAEPEGACCCTTALRVAGVAAATAAFNILARADASKTATDKAELGISVDTEALLLFWMSCDSQMIDKAHSP